VKLSHMTAYPDTIAHIYVSVGISIGELRWRFPVLSEKPVGEVRVVDVMSSNPVVVDSEANVEEAAVKMDRGDLGCVLVEVNGAVEGILTERDIVRRVVARGLPPKSTLVKDVMTKPIIAVPPDTPVEAALKLMSEEGVRRLAVVLDNKLVGLVTLTHVAKAVDAEWEHINALLAALTSQSSSSLEPYA
jgi:CBS domain-containing protein